MVGPSLRRAPALAAALLTVAAGVAAAAATATPEAVGGTVLAYPSARSVTGRGLPDGGARQIQLATGRGEREGAWIVAKGGGPVEAKVDAGSLGPLGIELAWDPREDGTHGRWPRQWAERSHTRARGCSSACRLEG